MMPGDWTCPNCQDLVFARNNACRRCSTPKPGAACMGTPSVASQPFSGATHGAVASPGPAYGRPSFSDIRPGDWHCPACFDLQFARNSTCRRCGTAHPGSSGQSVPSQQAMTAATFYSPPSVPAPMAGGVRGQEMRPGDWICPHCSDHVFAKNDACRRCSTPRPVGGAPQAPSSTNGYSSKPLDWGASQAGFEAELDKQHAAPAGCNGGGRSSPVPRAGDWICPSCNDLQFARNASCRRCGHRNPNSGDAGQQDQLGGVSYSASSERCEAPSFGSPAAGLEMRPGDWVCPRCNDHVFAKNSACRRCGTPRPTTNGYGYGQQPVTGGSQSMKPGDWYCPQCRDLQFARNSVCRICSTPRPTEANVAAVDGQRLRSRSPYRAD